MGLAGRKQKQRIPVDPRNLSWADDASRFGHTYLSKFGWDASQGLGSSGDGMKTHLKVQQKLDMMGIGARHQRDPNGVAWKQNKEFEALLRRLNDNNEQRNATNGGDTEGEGEREKTAVGKAFVRAQEEKAEAKLGDMSSVTTKKREHSNRNDPDTSKNAKRKRKRSSLDGSATSAIDRTTEPPLVYSPQRPHSELTPKLRPTAHRARIRAAKRIADKSASAISEVLGIAPSSSVSTSTSTPTPTPPSTLTPALQPSLSLDNLTTSTKSVADYFKEKLFTRSSSSSVPTPLSSSGSATPGPGAAGIGHQLPGAPSPDDGEPPRRGIGSKFPAVDADDRDTLMEKQYRNAGGKAEKRKRWEAEASQATPEGFSTDVKEQMEEDVERGQRTSKKHKKQKNGRELEQQAPTDQLYDHDDIKKYLEHDTPSPSKKFKKEHNKQHP